MIEKVDDRNAERIMRTEILDRFVIKSLPTDVSDLLSLASQPYFFFRVRMRV